MGKKDKVYKIGNDVYDIPENEVNSFLKENPKAVEVQSYKIGTDTFDIPSNEVPQFLKENPSAKQLGKELPATQVPRGSGVSISEGGTSGLAATTSDYLTFPTEEERLAPKPTTAQIPMAPGKEPIKKKPVVTKKEAEEPAFIERKGPKFENLRQPTEEELAQEEKSALTQGKVAITEIGGKKTITPASQIKTDGKKKAQIISADLYDPNGKISPLGSRKVSAQDPFNIDRENELKNTLNSFDEFKSITSQQQLNEDDEAKNFYLYYLQKNNPDEYKYQTERLEYNKNNPLESQKIQVELINKGLSLKQKAIYAKSEEINNAMSDDFFGYKVESEKFKNVNDQINSITPKIDQIGNELSSYPKDQNGNIIVNETNKRKVEKLISDYKVERQKYDNLIGQRDELLNSDFGTLIKKADELAQEDRKNYEYALNLEKKIKESDKFPELKKKLIEDAIKQEEDAKSWKETPEWVKWGVDTFSGIQRAGTELLKGIAFLPKAFGEKSGYGITDKISEYVDDSLTKYEEFAAPLSPDAKKDIFDYERNPDGTPKLDENGEKIEVTNWSALPYQLSNGAANLGLFIVSGGAGTALESANVLSKIGLGVKGASALNKAGTFAMGYTMSAKGNYDEAKSVGMTETQAISYSKYKTIPDALVELIFPEQKLITPTYKKESAKLAAKYISDGVSVKDAVVRASKELLGKVGGENIEELSALGSDYVSKLVAEKATGVDFKVNDDLMNKIKSTVLVTTILTTPFGLVGAKGTKNQMQSQSLFLAANKPNQVISDINELVDAKVITEEQAKVARERIEIASEALNTIPKEYSDDKKATALSLLVDKKILENKKKEIDPVFHENIDAQIKEKDDEIKKDVNRPDNGLTLEQNDELEDLTFKKENGVITETEQKQLDELNKFVEDYAKPKVKTVTKTMVTVEVVPEGQRFPMVTTIPKEEFEAFKQANPTANIVYEKEVEVKEKVSEEPKVEQEIKKQEDAIQEQTTGQVPLQPETKIGGEMEEGKPEAELEVVTEEGEAKPKEEVKVEDSLKDVESTAKALEGVDKRDLENISNSIGETLRKKKTKIDTENNSAITSYGKQIKFRISKSSDTEIEQDFLTITAIDNNGNKVGYAKFLDNGDGNLEGSEVEVPNKYQKQGIASAIYSYADAKGYKLKESVLQTPEGKALWRSLKTKQGSVQSISEAYHKAKKDGSNPELVKAVEDLLVTKPKEKQKEYEQKVAQEERVGKPGEEVQGMETKAARKRAAKPRTPKSKSKIKDKRLKSALDRTPKDPYEIVLQAILRGVKFKTSAFQKLFGNKRDLAFGGKIGKKALSEARSRFGLWNNKIGYDIDELAQKLWESEDYYETEEYDTTDFRNAIEEVLLSQTGSQSILDYFDNIAKQEGEQIQRMEEDAAIASFYREYGVHPDELNDYWENLTEEEQNALANENIVPDSFIPFVEEELESSDTKEEAEPTAEEKTIKQKAEELNKKIDAATEKLKNSIVDKNANNRLFSAPMITPKMISDLIDLSSAVIKKSITAGATIAQAVNDGINAIKNHPRYKRFVEAGQINEENFEKQIRDNYADLINEEETKAQEEAKKKEKEAKKKTPPAKPPVTTEAEKGPAPEGKKERATATRILENKKFHEDVVKRLSNEAIFYEPTSVKKSEEFVNAVIDEYEANGRLDDLVNEYMADKSDVIPDNQKLLFGDFLTKRLEDIATKEQNEFVRETLFDKAEQVFEKTAKNTTTAAQQLALIRNRDTRMFSNEIYMRRYAKKQFSEMQDNAMSEAQKNDIKSAQEIINEYRKSNEFAKEVEQATAEELKKIAETREGAGKVKQFNDIIDSLKVNLSDC